MGENPAQPTSRREFFDSGINIQFMLSVVAIKGERAANVLVRAEELVEMLEEIREEIQNKSDSTVDSHEYSDWGGHLRTERERLEYASWETLENTVETIAEKHDIALQKVVTVTGTGASCVNFRKTLTCYVFGETVSVSKISDENSPVGRTEWVGGSRGQPSQLQNGRLPTSWTENDEEIPLVPERFYKCPSDRRRRSGLDDGT